MRHFIFLALPVLLLSTCHPPHQYARLSPELSGSYVSSKNKLRFQLDKVYSDPLNSVDYTIVDYRQRIVQSETDMHLYFYGDNRVVLDVRSLCNGFYVLEVSNLKNEKEYLRFRLDRLLKPGHPCFSIRANDSNPSK